MKKPRELVKVGFREQRGTWRVAWWESPQHPGRPVHDRMGARVRKKSFGTEEAAKAYEVELLDKQDAAPEGGDPNMTLGVAFGGQTPAEIALEIVAEILSVRTGSAS